MKTVNHRQFTSLLMLSLALLSLTACSILGPQKVRHERSTGLVQFLYPDGQIPNNAARPILRLPLRVGLAFIPAEGNSEAVYAQHKLELLNRLKYAFEHKDYVQEIVVIPEMYLQNGGGFDHIQQLKSLFNLDALALVSYDQVVNRTENILALSYLTIVGSYIFPGSNYKVSTLIDLAVIDMDKHQILFRAAGTVASQDTIPEAYTQNAYNKQQRSDFSQAMQVLEGNLGVELNAFERRLRNREQTDIELVTKPGFELSFELYLLLILGFSAILKGCYQAQNKQ